jgi:AraC family transcriptional regulator
MRRRVTDDVEFVWMLRGQARLVSGHEDLALVPGHLVLMPPGVPHSFAWDQQRASRHGFVHFDADRVGLRDVSQIRLRRMTPHDPLAGLAPT